MIGQHYVRTGILTNEDGSLPCPIDLSELRPGASAAIGKPTVNTHRDECYRDGLAIKQRGI